MKGIYFIVCLLILSAIYGCGNAESEEVDKNKNIGRFEIVKEFRFSDKERFYRPNKGEIWKDRETGKCYLYIWSGGLYGGPSFTLFDCN